MSMHHPRALSLLAALALVMGCNIRDEGQAPPPATTGDMASAAGDAGPGDGGGTVSEEMGTADGGEDAGEAPQIRLVLPVEREVWARDEVIFGVEVIAGQPERVTLLQGERPVAELTAPDYRVAWDVSVEEEGTYEMAVVAQGPGGAESRTPTVRVHVDRTGPSLLSRVPSGTNASIHQPLELRFDEVLDPASLRDQNVHLLVEGHGPLPPMLSLSDNRRGVLITAATPPRPGDRWGMRVTLPGLVTDRAGNPSTGMSMLYDLTFPSFYRLPVTAPTTRSELPSAAVDARGRLVVGWRQCPAGRSNCAPKSFDVRVGLVEGGQLLVLGGNLQSQSAATTVASAPAVAVANDGALLAAFVEDGSLKVMRRSENSSWQAMGAPIAGVTGGGDQPARLAVGASEIFLVWQQASNLSTMDLHARRWDETTSSWQKLPDEKIKGDSSHDPRLRSVVVLPGDSLAVLYRYEQSFYVRKLVGGTQWAYLGNSIRRMEFENPRHLVATFDADLVRGPEGQAVLAWEDCLMTSAVIYETYCTKSGLRLSEIRLGSWTPWGPRELQPVDTQWADLEEPGISLASSAGGLALLWRPSPQDNHLLWQFDALEQQPYRAGFENWTMGSNAQVFLGPQDQAYVVQVENTDQVVVYQEQKHSER